MKKGPVVSSSRFVGTVRSPKHQAERVAMASLDMGSLYAASSVIATDCSEVNYAFLQCKKNHADPEACLTQGSAVIACTSAT